MQKLFQVNITANWGSHGRIAEEIGQLAIAQGWESYIAYGRKANSSRSRLITIGNKWDECLHGVQSILFDNHGMASENATRDLIRKIDVIKPDLIHLHNIHGYYLNYPILFDFLKSYNKPVVWTLHDCWCFTGHCTHFEYDGCFKWQSGCFDCQFKHVYPRSILLERSKRNYELKKKYFTSLDNLTLVPVSEWLGNYLKQSFMREQNIQVIHNGVDINTFKPLELAHSEDNIEILGIASNWKMRKGLPDFIKLRTILPANYHITLIGLSKKEIEVLPKGVSGIERNSNVDELVGYYNKADVLVNPTYEDNFPTINLEALACGTPVITYKTGGSPESIDERTGVVIEQGDIVNLAESIIALCGEHNKNERREACRLRAVSLYNQENCYRAYLDLYDKLLNNR